MRFGVMQAILGLKTEEAITAAGQVGFDGIQLVIGSDYFQNPLWTEDGAIQMARRADRARVEICSICTGVLNQIGLASPDPRGRWRASDILTHAIDACDIMRVPRILVPFFGKMALEDKAGARRVVEELSKLLPKAERLKIVLAIECTLSAVDTLDIIKGVDSPYVRVYYDMGNAYRFGMDPCEEIRLLGDLIEEVHIKDATRGGIVPLGEGEVDLKAVLAALRDIDYDDYLVLETRLGEDTVADAKKDLAYSRGVLRDLMKPRKSKG